MQFVALRVKNCFKLIIPNVIRKKYYVKSIENGFFGTLSGKAKQLLLMWRDNQTIVDPNLKTMFFVFQQLTPFQSWTLNSV